MILDKNELVKYFYENRKLFFKGIVSYGLDAEDVVHDCCLKILESKRDEYNLYNGERENYLRRFVNNHCRDVIKKRKKIVGLGDVDIRDEVADYTGYLDVLNNSNLTLIRKQVIYGHFWKDLTYKQLGEELNINSGTLKSAFRRSKEDLKLLFKQI